MSTPAFSTSKAVSREATPYHSVVVGDDIVGRAYTLWLAQTGLRVAHIAPPVPASTPAGPDAWNAYIYVFSSSSQALLEQLHIWPALDMTRVRPVHNMRIFGGNAVVRGEHAHPDLHSPAYVAGTPQLTWIAKSSFVEHALETALRFAHTVQSSLHVTTGFEMETNAVKLTLADGQTIRAECVIGADGEHPWAHEQVGIQVEAKLHRQLNVAANFQAEHWHQDTAWQWFPGTSAEQAATPDDDPPVRGEALTMLLLPDRHASMVRFANEDHARELLALSPKVPCRAVEAAAGSAVAVCLGCLSNITPAQGFPFVLQHISRAVALHAVLVGDATHVIHPLAEQGMSPGLRDVSRIGRVMAERETMRDHGDLKLLCHYERACCEDLLLLVAATDGLHRLFALSDALPRTVRDVGTRMVGMIPSIKRLLTKHALD